MSGVQRPVGNAFLAVPAPVTPPGRPPQPDISLPPTQSVNSPIHGGHAPQLKPVQIAAHTINEALVQESRYPELESYVTQGISSDYEIVSSPAWAPFQMVKMHEIPDRILEQHDQRKAHLSTMMGLFAELNYAWITIDNALFLWNYSDPQPELIGFDDQPNSITAVKLVVPRPGVFIPSVTHLIVVATTADIFLIGVSPSEVDGRKSVSLYQTKMRTSVKGIDVTVIEGSPQTGRIFFGGRASNHLYELMYQQEERWFQAKCDKVNHTSVLYKFVLPYFPFGANHGDEVVQQLAIDDSRKLLYTLSSKSTVRVFHMRTPTLVTLVITRTLDSIKTDISHMVTKTNLLRTKVSIVAISPISANEASRVNLMAVTSTGVRIFFSVTSDFGFVKKESDAPNSMQVIHVKFPPSRNDPSRRLSQAGLPSNLQHGSSGHGLAYSRPGVDTDSDSLRDTQYAIRYAPGYFFDVVRRPNQEVDSLFISAPDCGSIAWRVDTRAVSQFVESAFQLPLQSAAEDIGLVVPAVPAANTPVGYGNELAVQYDKPVPEVAVLTNTGVHTFRRRRLVDIFASVIRSRAAEDGIELAVKTFVRLYGRQELAATALGVACGQAIDVSDARITAVTDPEIIDAARNVFIEHGGKAVWNENNIPDRPGFAIDQVRPSPRHGGVALYISRLVRSLWHSRILYDASVKDEKRKEMSKINPKALEKLRQVQQDLTKLASFLDRNKMVIEGLAGPEALGRVATKQEEIALQGEHRAMHALVQLITVIVESISFALVLFENDVGEIFVTLPDDQRQQFRELTLEDLCCSESGRQLARELVKAIVNRNIASGASVEAVADALRRRCGSFCSADDVVIFKAREQLTRAADTGAESDQARMLLNSSLDLFRSVVGSIDLERLREAVTQYINMSFFAGSIKLILEVAQHIDPANRALGWIRDGKPEDDIRREKFQSRFQCYLLVQDVVQAVDRAFEQVDPRDPFYPAMVRRKNEAYAEINATDDEVFLTTLFDWYIENGWTDRILALTSDHVVQYLRRQRVQSSEATDLLWQYFAHRGDFYSAAEVQYELAQSTFDISLVNRLEYLSRAKANASTRLSGMADLRSGRHHRQQLLRDVTDSLEVGLVQQDILQRMRADPRPITPEAREAAVAQLNGIIHPVTTLFNEYTQPLGYHDISIVIYHVSDHRNTHDIMKTWTDLFDQLTERANSSPTEAEAYQLIAGTVLTLGRRLNLSPLVFPIAPLIHLLLTHSIEKGYGSVAPTQQWILDVFLELKVPFDSIAKGFEAAFLSGNQRIVAPAALGIYHVLEKWFVDSVRGGGMLFGGGAIVDEMVDLLQYVATSNVLNHVLDQAGLEEFTIFRSKVDAALRSTTGPL